MSEYIDQIKTEKDLPISYSINIKSSKRPLTCYITTTPRLNYIKPSICTNKTHDFRLKSPENKHRSSIHLPVTYSTSVHVPCHPSTITLRPPVISPSSHHHYHHHHYYYHYYHHHRQPSSPSSRQSTTIKPTSIDSTQPPTTSTTTSPQSLSLSKKSKKNIHLSLPNPTSNSLNNKQPPPHPLPSYSTLVWNWFHHTPTKPQSSPHKGSQSDYSEIHRHDLPSKRSLLFKLLTSPTNSPSKSKHTHTCFRRKRFESSSSLPNKYPSYTE